MRDYAKLAPTFWTRGSGKRLRGNPVAQVVAAYLFSAPGSNMIGLYYLPIPVLAHETGLGIEGASEGLRRVCEESIAHYDSEAELVWLPEGARIQIGESLAAADKRCKGIVRELISVGNHRFVGAFLHKYGGAFHLEIKGVEARPLEAPSVPLGSQDQDQDQDQEREQDIELSRWLQLWKAWEMVSANGMPCGDAKSHRGRLELAWDAYAARNPADPVAAFVSAATAYCADRVRFGKRAQLHWLCTDLGAWLAAEPISAKSAADQEAEQRDVARKRRYAADMAKIDADLNARDRFVPPPASSAPAEPHDPDADLSAYLEEREAEADALDLLEARDGEPT